LLLFTIALGQHSFGGRKRLPKSIYVQKSEAGKTLIQKKLLKWLDAKARKGGYFSIRKKARH